MRIATPRRSRQLSYRSAKDKQGRLADKHFTKVVREQSGGLAEPDVGPDTLFDLVKIAATGGLAAPAVIAQSKIKKAFGKMAAGGFEKFLNKGVKYIDNDFAPTPERIADNMIDWITDKGKRNIGKVLEPHAGEGNIAKQIHKRTGVMPDALELDTGRHAKLVEQGIPAKQGNFLDMEAAEVYDSIVMNPPFSGGQAKVHILKGYEALKPGGKMTAVVPDREFAKRKAGKYSTPLRRWADETEGVTDMGHYKMPTKDGRTSVRVLGITKGE